MRIYIDSADRQAVAEALKSGYVYGVTMNPTLLNRAGVSAREVPDLARWVIGQGARELHLQVYAEDTPGMLQDAVRLAELDPARIVVKIPATPAGYAAAAQLTAQGMRITLTAVATAAQAILAHSVGAHYIAVYLGRLRDDGIDSLGLVGQMQRTLNAQRAEARLLVASIRAPADVEAVAELGAGAVTLPPDVLRQLPDSPRTLTAVAAFSEDARAVLRAAG